MIIYFHEYDLRMLKSEADNVNYYAFHRAAAIINDNLKIGRVFMVSLIALPNQQLDAQIAQIIIARNILNSI